MTQLPLLEGTGEGPIAARVRHHGAGAVFSPCGRYRYALWRVWDPSRPLTAVLGINPSTAGADEEDHTTSKLAGFGSRLGWGGILLGNPFGLVSTDQRGLLTAEDPIGPDNDRHLERIFRLTTTTLCAWGTAKTGAVRRLLDERLLDLAPMLDRRTLVCLGRAKDGSPRHPLMLSYSTPLEPWSVR